ncbi:MAG: single-stranded DNA-binding protein [Gomphosphaeria aponina SAG 52.96 = DSM 107014]|uniref:Single-stranded DNA-binding protein n=1 Tax=Gomphosphaeria aponina SAG 52.96 = DSM 107014 TaxID=1521640 RepID=A0A941GTC6_9CHRO|nr:single-stranded DNA-binding protein [Gomphosphaeria aponina SAG 52.96 = DSM 107014]
MNSCILMGKIVRSPELRYTQENQTPIAQMLVEFEGPSASDQVATLKVVAWGNMATETQEKYTEGDRVIIEGRLSMNRIERPEGVKETVAELVASHIYPLSTEETAPTSSRDNVIPLKKPEQTPEYDDAETGETEAYSNAEPVNIQRKNADLGEDKNLDDIPF